ncbi:MAG: glycosyltransferase family 87 protein [Terracidiphilus sp.]
MTKARMDGLYLLLVGFAAFAVAGLGLESIARSSLVDFRAVYYSARCLLEHRDPYSASEMLRVYREEEIDHPHPDPIGPSQIQAVTVYVYFPTASIFIAPFALLPWGPAHVVWMVFIAASVILATWLIWSIAAEFAPVISGALAGLLLLCSVDLFVSGNAAAMVVSLCAIAVWCFLRDRCTAIGVLCFAAALLVKPHDAGLIWLYFLLAGGVQRKRALQVLAATVVLGLASTLWIWHVSPHWIEELRANLEVTSSHGGLSDPSPAATNTGTASMMTGLETIVAVFRDDPRIYNPLSYLLWAPFLAVWAITTIRSRFSVDRAWMALAAMAPLSMLPTLHRPNDTKILLLAIPACAMLWAGGGIVRWLALCLTSACIVLTAGIPIAFIVSLAKSLHLSTATLSGKIETVALARPAPLILLATGVFFLWTYARQTSSGSGKTVLLATSTN